MCVCVCIYICRVGGEGGGRVCPPNAALFYLNDIEISIFTWLCRIRVLLHFALIFNTQLYRSFLIYRLRLIILTYGQPVTKKKNRLTAMGQKQEV